MRGTFCGRAFCDRRGGKDMRMKKYRIFKIGILIGMGSLCLFLLGCSDSKVIFEEATTESVNGTDSVGNAGGAGNISGTGIEELPSDLTEEEVSGTALEEAEPELLLLVHVCGAVQNPGVYSLERGQRICHAVEAAGGFLAEAEETYVNQAQVIEDGMKITIPTKEEVLLWKQQNQTGLESGAESKGTSGNQGDSKVNINTADEAALCTLPGIGESRARSILAYREEHGRFGRIEDIMNVSGIKEAAFEKIKQYLTVS